jgi:hypothetical protein
MLTEADFLPRNYQPPKRVIPAEGVPFLAYSLGVSRRRANELLKTNRVVGAVRDSKSGYWDLTNWKGRIRPGKRGPELRSRLRQNPEYK